MAPPTPTALASWPPEIADLVTEVGRIEASIYSATHRRDFASAAALDGVLRARLRQLEAAKAELLEREVRALPKAPQARY